MMSAGPPAANGTIMMIGRSGYTALAGVHAKRQERSRSTLRNDAHSAEAWTSLPTFSLRISMIKRRTEQTNTQ